MVKTQKVIKISTTEFMFLLELILLEKKCVTSVLELDWPAVNHFYESSAGGSYLISLSDKKWLWFKKNYKQRKSLWLKGKGKSPNKNSSLKCKLREIRDNVWREGLTKNALNQLNWGTSDNTSSRMGIPPGDKLQGRYLTTELDGVWTADVTKLGKLCVLAFMDLGTRQVIGHRLMVNYPSCEDVVSLMSSIISSRQHPRIFHSDSDGIFTGSALIKFLNDSYITISRGNQNYSIHHNQAHERFHLTFKDWLHLELYDELVSLYGVESAKTRQAAWELLASKPFEQAMSLVTKVIERYNSTYHRGLGASPNMMDTAVAVYGGGVSIMGRKGSKEGDKVEAFRKLVITKYANDWQRFFIDFYNKNLEEHKLTQRRIEQNAERVIMALEKEISGLESSLACSTQEVSILQSKLAKMEESLSYLSKREASREQEELDKRDRQARRRARKRRPLREALFVKEYNRAQSYLLGDRFEVCRDRVCLLLLFLTGLRVRSLLLTTAGHLSTLLSFLTEDEQTLVYPGIKSANAEDIKIPLPIEALPLIEVRQNDIKRLLSGRAPEEAVMSRTEGSTSLLSITNLNKRLNRIMEKLSGETGKIFRTHSFRIGLTTSLVATAGIEIARDIIGHRDFRTTASYNRHRPSQRELCLALGKSYMRSAPRKRKSEGLPLRRRKGNKESKSNTEPESQM